MFRTFCLLVIAFWLCCPVSPAQAAQQELPPLPFDRLDVQVVRASEILLAGAIGPGGSFMVGGMFLTDGGYADRLKLANAVIRPALGTLAGYDFNTVIEARLVDAIREAGLSTHPTLTVVPTDRVGPVTASQDVLLTYTTVVLSPDFTSLDITVNAHLDRREPRGTKDARVQKRFIRPYVFHVVVDPAAGDPLAFWNDLPRERYVQLFDEAASQIGAMLVQDFSEEGRATWWTKPVDSRTVFLGKVLVGHATERDGEIVWSVVGKNWGRSIHGYKAIR